VTLTFTGTPGGKMTSLKSQDTVTREGLKSGETTREKSPPGKHHKSHSIKY